MTQDVVKEIEKIIDRLVAVTETHSTQEQIQELYHATLELQAVRDRVTGLQVGESVTGLLNAFAAASRGICLNVLDRAVEIGYEHVDRPEGSEGSLTNE